MPSGHRGSGRGSVLLGKLLTQDEHTGRGSCLPVQQRREAVPLVTVDEDHLRGGVGQDVLQPLVRVREVQGYVRPARADDRHQGDHLVQGAWDGDGDAAAGTDTGRAQGRGQLVLRGGQFAVGQGPGCAVEGAVGDGGGRGVASCRGVEQGAQRRRGEGRGAAAGVGRQVVDEGVRPCEQAGEGAGERVEDGPGACFAQQLLVVDQVEARPAVGGAFHDQGQRVVGGSLVHDAGDGELVAGPTQCVHIGRDVEDDQGVEQGAPARLAAGPRQGDVLVRQHRALVFPHRGEEVAGTGGRVPTGSQRDGVDEEAHHVLDTGQLRVTAGHGGTEHHVPALQDASQRHGPGAVHRHAQRHAGRADRRVDVVLRDHRGVGEPVGGGVAVGDQGGAGQAGELFTPDPVALLVVDPGEAAYVVGEAAERIPAARCVVLGQQGTEHRGDGPAVGDDVVHGLHQHGPSGSSGTAADERVPHERAGGEVEPGPPVPLGVLADPGFGDAGSVECGEGRLHPALQYGDHPAVGEGDEACGQVRVEGEQPGRRRCEPVRVHLTLQREELLLDVAARGVVVEDRVEVEALLQRGQREDVQQRRSVQRVHVALGERHQGEVAGRVAALFEGGQPGEGFVQVGADGRGVLVGEHSVGPGDGGDELVRAVRGGFGDRVELQGPRQAHHRVALLAQLARGAGELPVPGRARVEAAQVVEQHLRGGGVEPGVGQIPQDAVGKTVARHPGEVVLDGLQCGGQVRGVGGVGRRTGVHDHREEGGEPAERPGEFRLEAGAVRDEPRFAAVSFEFDVCERLVLPEVTAPPGEGDGEPGQQHVVDAGMELRGYLPQQGRGGLRAHGDGPGAFAGDGVGRRQRAPAHRVVDPGQGALEDGTVSLEVGARQHVCPAPEGGAHRRELDGCTGRELLPGGGQVLHQDPPGHSVDDHVVDDHDEFACLAAPDGAQHRAVLGVEPVRGESHAGVEWQTAFLPSHGGAAGLRDVEAPAVAADQPGAQHVVPRGHRAEDRVEGVGGQVRRGVQHDRLHEAVDGVRGLAEPLDDGRSDDRSGGHVVVSLRGDVLTGHDRGERPHDAVGEDLARRDMEARGAQCAQQRDRQDAVPSEPEEVLVDPDLVEPQDGRDRLAHRALVLGGGRDERAGPDAGLRERRPVDLAVRGERELLQHDDVGGHHVVHHVLGRPRRDLVAPQRLAAGDGDDVPHQVGAARGVLLRDDAGVPHGGVLPEPRLDVLGLQPHSADLDLVVGPAEEVQRPVRGEACEVTGPVQPGPVPREGVRDEPGGRQAGGVDVAAPQEEPSYVQFAAHSDGDRAQFVVEHVQLGVGVGLADRRRQAFRLAAVDDVRDADRRLGRAVAVVHRDVEAGPEALVQLGGQDLTAAPDVPQAVQPAGVAGHLQQDIQHGGHEVGERDALFGQHAEQVLGIAFAAGTQDDEPAAADERQEDLVDGDVEGQWCLEQGGVVVAEAEDLLRLPQQALADGLVTDHRALGAAGRAGREDHIGEGGSGDGDARRPRRAGGVPPGAEVDGRGGRFAVPVLARVVELQHDAGVLDDDGPALGGPGRVERDERASGLQHPEQPDDHVRRPAQRYPDDLFGGEPALDQMVRQLCRELRRLPVRQRPVLVDDRDGVGTRPCLLLEHLDDGGAEPVGPGVVPLVQGLEPRLRADGGDGAQRPVGEVGQVVQGELRVGRHHVRRGPDAAAVRPDLPAGGRGAALADPPEHVGEQGGRGEVDPVGAGARRPVRQPDGARLGDRTVGVVPGPPAYVVQTGGGEQHGASSGIRHRRLVVLPA